MLLFLRSCYSIEGIIHSSLNNPKITFKVPIKSKKDVIVNILLDENRIESFHEVEISDEMLDALQNDKFFKNDTLERLDKELLEMKSCISSATGKVLHLIKYSLQQVDLNEKLLSIKNHSWSTDKSEWKIVPSKLFVTLDSDKILTLNEEKSVSVQRYIDDDFKSFVALRHLHRAKNESIPRYKWIDATIAAELAIKEFLIRKVPNIEHLLMEVPSPPLHKLYGTVLKEYAGEKSPRLKEIQEGVRIRNILVHRPEDIDIEIKVANKYIHDVETAIYHLLFLLFPNDPNIYSLYITYQAQSFIKVP
jgi:hypothetical protein